LFRYGQGWTLLLDPEAGRRMVAFIWHYRVQRQPPHRIAQRYARLLAAVQAIKPYTVRVVK
jgi:hypothetical protein